MKILFEEDRPYCVICPNVLKDDFLSFKESLLEGGPKERFLDLALSTKEEAISLFGLQKDPRSLRHLLQKGYSYEFSKELLSAFCAPFFEKANLEKLAPYKTLRQELLDLGYLWRYSYPEKDFVSKHIIITGYGETKRLSETIGNCSSNLMVSFLSLPKKEMPKCYYSFKNVYEELHFVLNEIAHEIDVHHTSPDDIYLAGVTEEHYFYLKDLAPLYGFEVDIPSTIRLFDHPAYRFFRKAYLDQDFYDSLNEAQAAFPDVSFDSFEKEAVDLLGTFDEKEKMALLFDELAKEKKAKKIKKKNVVSLLEGFLAPDGAKVFCLHFAMGVYPNVFKDEGFLSSEEKERLGLESASEKNKESSFELASLLESGKVRLITYKERAFGSTFFPSGFASSFNIEKAKPPFQEYEYSHSKGAYLLSMLLDKKTDYDEDDARIAPLKELADPPFRLYDYRLQENLRVPQKRSFSQGSLDDLVSCPFRYLLRRVLRIDPSEETWRMKLGTYFHKVLEDHYKDPSLSFDELYQKAYESLSLETHYSEKERFFLQHLKPYSEKNVRFFDDLDKTLPNIRVSLEGFFESKTPSDLSIYGRYDKIVTFGEEEKYLCLVDYKSGSTTFDLELFEKFGLGSQLPFYLFYAKHSENYKDFKIAGLFIAPLLNLPFNSERPDKYDEDDAKGMRLDGIYLDDYSLWKNVGLWKNEKKETSLSFAHMNISKTAGLSNNKQAFTEEKFENLCKTLLSFLFKAKEKIEFGDYSISPLRLKEKDACQGCLYRDICFRKERDFPLLNKKDGTLALDEEDAAEEGSSEGE